MPPMAFKMIRPGIYGMFQSDHDMALNETSQIISAVNQVASALDISFGLWHESSGNY